VDDLLPIGRFARATRLSVKALRHYDELGLLRPAFVDPSSGYRYYRPAQANQAEAIRILRSLEMPLEEIGELLAEGGGEPVAKRLRLHRERLEARLAEHRRMLAFLQRLLDKEDIMPYEVTVKELPAQPVAATRTTTDLRGIATATKRSKNSHMRAPRSVTAAPISCPSRSPKFAIDFFARRRTGRCPVIVSSSSTTVAISSGNMVPRTWPRYSATRYMARIWAANVLVAATQTSGPARV